MLSVYSVFSSAWSLVFLIIPADFFGCFFFSRYKGCSFKITRDRSFRKVWSLSAYWIYFFVNLWSFEFYWIGLSIRFFCFAFSYVTCSIWSLFPKL